MTNKNNYFNRLNEIPLVRKLYELYKDFYSLTTLFPKKDKYAIGSKCENYILTALELTLATTSAPKSEKYALIRQASVKFDTLKIFIRLCKDLDLLGLKQYIRVQKQLQEIGRMLGGWQRSLL